MSTIKDGKVPKSPGARKSTTVSLVAGGAVLMAVVLATLILALTPGVSPSESASERIEISTPQGPSPDRADAVTAPVETTSVTPPPPPPPVYEDPTPEDFDIEVVVTRKACFGSAGCNVTYEINPTYSGPEFNPYKSYTVLYEVTGGEYGPETGSFSYQGTYVSAPDSSMTTTSSQGKELTAKVVRILG